MDRQCSRQATIMRICWPPSYGRISTISKRRCWRWCKNWPFKSQSPPQENRAEVAPVQEVANATIGANVQLQMLQILQAMQAAQAANGNQQQGPQGQHGGNGNRERGRTNKKTPDDASFNLGDKSKYCHTHGACNHASSECNRKAPGHRNNATFQRKMGGSNAFCQAAVAPTTE